MRLRLRLLWRNYSLGIFYALGWALTWGLHALLTWHNSTFFPHDAIPWAWYWLETSFENLASEYHQIGIFVFATRWLRFRGSHESKRVETPNGGHD